MRMRALAGLVCAGLAAPVMASAPPESPYADALAAARAGDFERALERLEAARRAGVHTPTLLYNLGVVHFRLDQLDASYAAFLQLTEDERWRALAHYNLGLIEERRGRAGVARGHFQRAQTLTTSVELRALAEGKLRPEPSPGAPARATVWHGLASLGIGFDDNVILADDRLLDDVSDEADAFGEILAAVRRPLGTAVVLDVAGYHRAHAELDHFDFGAVSAALTWRGEVEDWHLSSGLRLEIQSAGGDGYADVVTHRLAFARSSGAWSVRSRNDLSRIFAGSDFDYVSGWRNRTSVQLVRLGPGADLRLGYEFELNDRADLQVDTAFSSYSPKRHRIHGSATLQPIENLDVELQASLRFSEYDDDNRFIDETGAWTQAPRDQDMVELGVRVSYSFAPDWSLWTHYERSDSDSELQRYTYRSHRILFGIETTF